VVKSLGPVASSLGLWGSYKFRRGGVRAGLSVEHKAQNHGTFTSPPGGRRRLPAVSEMPSGLFMTHLGGG